MAEAYPRLFHALSRLGYLLGPFFTDQDIREYEKNFFLGSVSVETTGVMAQWQSVCLTTGRSLVVGVVWSLVGLSWVLRTHTQGFPTGHDCTQDSSSSLCFVNYRL